MKCFKKSMRKNWKEPAISREKLQLWKKQYKIKSVQTIHTVTDAAETPSNLNKKNQQKKDWWIYQERKRSYDDAWRWRRKGSRNQAIKGTKWNSKWMLQWVKLYLMEFFKVWQMLTVVLSKQVKTWHYLTKLKNQNKTDLTNCK